MSRPPPLSPEEERQQASAWAAEKEDAICRIMLDDTLPLPEKRTLLKKIMLSIHPDKNKVASRQPHLSSLVGLCADALEDVKRLMDKAGARAAAGEAAAAAAEARARRAGRGSSSSAGPFAGASAAGSASAPPPEPPPREISEPTRGRPRRSTRRREARYHFRP